MVLENPSKRLALARLVEVKKPNVFLLQETMGVGRNIVEDLGKLFNG
jgi:hypothetical protein